MPTLHYLGSFSASSPLATTYVLLIGRILLSTRQVRHLHLAVDGLVNMRRLSVIAGNRNWSNIANSNKS
jgi:hypothetical protein